MLDELTGGDPALAASVLSDFLGTSREDLRALADAAAAQDHEQVRRQAHRIAGAAGSSAPASSLRSRSGSRTPPRRNRATPGIRSLVDRLDAALAKIAERVPARPLTPGSAASRPRSRPGSSLRSARERVAPGA